MSSKTFFAAIKSLQHHCLWVWLECPPYLKWISNISRNSLRKAFSDVSTSKGYSPVLENRQSENKMQKMSPAILYDETMITSRLTWECFTLKYLWKRFFRRQSISVSWFTKFSSSENHSRRVVTFAPRFTIRSRSDLQKAFANFWARVACNKTSSKFRGKYVYYKHLTNRRLPAMYLTGNLPNRRCTLPAIHRRLFCSISNLCGLFFIFL